MRCLIVADLHYSLPQFDWLLSAAPQFDLVIFAGDALDIGSAVAFRAQIVVVKKYLARLAGLTRVILCSGNHDLDERNPEGEKIARWIGDVRALGIACDGDSLTIGDTLFTVCPWWDGPLVKQRIDDQLREAAAARRHLGVQPRPSTRPPAGAYRARYRQQYRVLAAARRRAMHRPQRAIAAACRADQQSSGVAYILGSDCRSEPGEILIGGRLIMLCRISPTIAK